MTFRKSSVIIVQNILLLSFLVRDGEFYTTLRKYCTLPNGNSARCLLIEDCEPIAEYLNTTKLTVRAREVQRKLGYYSCENNRWKEPTHVCCPEGSFTDIDETPPPPDVTNHTNLHLLPTECGIIGIADKIQNGEDALFNEFPWMALLSYNTTKGPVFMCGGTIINDRYILTAAHCVINLKSPLIGVRVGEYNLLTKDDCEVGNNNCLPPVQDLAIEKIIYPEDYNVTLYANDIALVRVTKIELTDNAQPVCLPVLDDLRNLEVIKGVVTGWGFIDSDDNTPAILQKVILERRDIAVCKKAYSIEPSIRLGYKQFCIGGLEKKDSCAGDSGGPLHFPAYFDDADRYVQYGIVSAGPLYCGYNGTPGIYTTVSYYMEWILNNLEP